MYIITIAGICFADKCTLLIRLYAGNIFLDKKPLYINYLRYDACLFCDKELSSDLIFSIDTHCLKK